MLKALSLKLREDIFEETEEIRKITNMPRNRYINNALEFFNRIQKRKLLKGKLQNESRLVAEESLSVLKEFENIEYKGE